MATLEQLEEQTAKRLTGKLFGATTRVPAKGMLEALNRPYKTYLDNIRESSDVAQLQDAFGGRGALLIHACISQQPPKAKPKKAATQEIKKVLVQVIHGNMGPVGDLRRFDQTLRLSGIKPCEPKAFAPGNGGLIVPAESDPTWATHFLGRVFASLDFQGLQRLIDEGFVSGEKIIPAVEISTNRTKRREELEKIESSFMAPKEAQELQALVTAGKIEELDVLERTVLPLAYVPCLPDKVMLFRISDYLMSLGDNATEQFQLVTNACNNVTQSSQFLDLLAVMIQTASYVANFGDAATGQGFSLTKIQQYEDFALGKHSFLSIICSFLMNLNPGFKKKKKKNEKSQPSFLEILEDQVREARHVCKTQLTKDVLYGFQQEVVDMEKIVAEHVQNEGDLFDPSRSRELAELSAEERFAELSVWVEGRLNLRGLYHKVVEVKDSLAELSQKLDNAEMRLQEFAALRPQDFKTQGYIEILSTLLNFVDRFSVRWNQLIEKPGEQHDLLCMLTTASAVAALFKENRQFEAFNLWRAKRGRKEVPMWTDDGKRDVLTFLFRLFDADGNGSMDPAEVGLSLKAFGLEVPEDSISHFLAVQLLDVDGTGTVDLDEFTKFVEHQIEVTFKSFLSDGNKDITKADLRRVATENKVEIEDDELRGMINFFDCNGSSDGLISLAAFEQIILMIPPETRLDVTTLEKRSRHDRFDSTKLLSLEQLHQDFLGIAEEEEEAEASVQ